MRYRKLLTRATTPWIAGLFATAILFAGCGDQAIVNTTEDNAPPFTPILVSGAERGLELQANAYLFGNGILDPSFTVWSVVGEGYAHHKKHEDIVSEKCVLHFSPGAVDSRTLITISMYDDSILDFQFSPHGILFNNPVGVDVSYVGTNADPDSPNYDGSVPAFFYFNDFTGQWEELPGQINQDEKTYSSSLTHFSRYALGGRPGPGDGTADW